MYKEKPLVSALCPRDSNLFFRITLLWLLNYIKMINDKTIRVKSKNK